MGSRRVAAGLAVAELVVPPVVAVVLAAHPAAVVVQVVCPGQHAVVLALAGHRVVHPLPAGLVALLGVLPQAQGEGDAGATARRLTTTWTTQRGATISNQRHDQGKTATTFVIC